MARMLWVRLCWGVVLADAQMCLRLLSRVTAGHSELHVNQHGMQATGQTSWCQQSRITLLSGSRDG